MNKVKVVNKETKVEKLVNKNIAGDFLATGEWEVLKEDEPKTRTSKTSSELTTLPNE